MSRVIEIPITNDVIESVEMLAKRDGIQQDLKFKNRKGELTPDTGSKDCDVGLIAGVDDDDLNHNYTEDPYPDPDNNDNPLPTDDPDDLVNITNDYIAGVGHKPPNFEDKQDVPEDNQTQPPIELR